MSPFGKADTVWLRGVDRNYEYTPYATVSFTGFTLARSSSTSTRLFSE